MIETIIAEDNHFMGNHLVSMLEADPRFRLLALVRDAFEAEVLCEKGKIDLVLMDVQTLHNHSGLAAGKRIREMPSPPKVLIITSLIDPQILSRAKAGGADSLWYKDHGNTELMEVIERTLAGERVFPETSPSVELKEMFSGDISPRQIDILRLFVAGLTYDEIARRLGITKNGVRWNLEQVMEKGGFTNKHELLAALIENRLIVTTLKEE